MSLYFLIVTRDVLGGYKLQNRLWSPSSIALNICTTVFAALLLFAPVDVLAESKARTVILHPDGSWDYEKGKGADNADQKAARSTIQLREIHNPATNVIKRVWMQSPAVDQRNDTASFVHVLVSRAVSKPKSQTYPFGGCLPVISIWNLSNLTINRLVVGVEFIFDDGRPSEGRSILTGELDHGEREDINVAELQADGCEGIAGAVGEIYCQYDGADDCMSDVIVSKFGVIPLNLKPGLKAGH